MTEGRPPGYTDGRDLSVENDGGPHDPEEPAVPPPSTIDLTGRGAAPQQLPGRRPSSRSRSAHAGPPPAEAPKPSRIRIRPVEAGGSRSDPGPELPPARRPEPVTHPHHVLARGRDVYFTPAALTAISDHARSSRDEVGGFLTGRTGEDARGPFTVVSRAHPALEAQGHRVALEIPPAAFVALQRILDETPDERSVGWYHTHPSLGIFLSGYDTFLHEHFFRLPGQIAVVADPAIGDAGIFVSGSEGGAPLSPHSANAILTLTPTPAAQPEHQVAAVVAEPGAHAGVTAPADAAAEPPMDPSEGGAGGTDAGAGTEVAVAGEPPPTRRSRRGPRHGLRRLASRRLRPRWICRRSRELIQQAGSAGGADPRPRPEPAGRPSAEELSHPPLPASPVSPASGVPRVRVSPSVRLPAASPPVPTRPAPAPDIQLTLRGVVVVVVVLTVASLLMFAFVFRVLLDPASVERDTTSVALPECAADDVEASFTLHDEQVTVALHPVGEPCLLRRTLTVTATTVADRPLEAGVVSYPIDSEIGLDGLTWDFTPAKRLPCDVDYRFVATLDPGINRGDRKATLLCADGTDDPSDDDTWQQDRERHRDRADEPPPPRHP